MKIVKPLFKNLTKQMSKYEDLSIIFAGILMFFIFPRITYVLDFISRTEPRDRKGVGTTLAWAVVIDLLANLLILLFLFSLIY